MSDSTSMKLSVLKKHYDAYIDDSGFFGRHKRKQYNLWNQLVALAESKGVDFYTSELGKELVEAKKHRSRCLALGYRRAVYIFDCILNNEPIKQVIPKEVRQIPVSFSPAVEQYLNFCSKNGLSDETISNRRRYIRDFCENLVACDCKSLDEITPTCILRATLMNPKANTWSIVKQFLGYLADEKILSTDYSGLIPTRHIGFHLPDTYTKNELRQLESAFDLNKPKGRRDYAITLLATRMLYRSGDIADLEVSHINFDTNRISFSQNKTTDFVDFPMDTALRNALLDYIQHDRPEICLPYVFLSTRHPYTKLTNAGIYSIISKGFKASNIDIEGRHIGGHAVRSSGATNQINDGVSYYSVQKMLGHRSSEAIRHYASIDIPNLRECAISPPKVTEASFFELFLAGGASL